MKNTVHLAHGRTDEQLEVMRRIQKDGVDPFDWSLLPKYHREPIIKRGEFWVITPNDYPYEGSTLHLLLIYRDAVQRITEVDQAAFLELWESLAWIEKEYRLTHGALVMRFGEPSLTGASVHHLHLHIIVGSREVTDEKLKASIGYK